MKIKLLKLIRNNYDYKTKEYSVSFISKDGLNTLSLSQWDLIAIGRFSNRWVVLLVLMSDRISIWNQLVCWQNTLIKFETTRKIRKNKKEFRNK